MRKKLLLLLSVLLIAYAIPQKITATSFAYEDYEETERLKQEKINEIISELNGLAAEKAHNEYLYSSDVCYEEEANIAKYDSQFLERNEELYIELENWGARKLELENEKDMEILVELLNASVGIEDDLLRSSPMDTAPTLDALREAFTIVYSDGTYVYNGKEYPYRSITLIDNIDEALNRFTWTDRYDVVPMNLSNALLQNVLTYNFGYGFSYFLGKTPTGVMIDWTLGNIFNVLNTIEGTTPISYSGSDSLYEISCTSVTSMTYHYCCDNLSWKLIGTSASMSMVQTDSFRGNIGGLPVHDDFHHPRWETTSGKTAIDYVKEYINFKDYMPNYHRVDALGSLEIKGFETKFLHTPKFFELPGYIW